MRRRRRRQKLAISAQGDFDRQRIVTCDYLQIGRTDRLSLRRKSSISRGAAFASKIRKLHRREGVLHSPRRHGFGRIPSRTYDSGAETQPGACGRHSPCPRITGQFQIWGLPPLKLQLTVRVYLYLAYWNWPFSAGSMPRFPSSARAENGCNRRVWLIGEGSYRSGTHNSKPRFGRGPRRQPPGRRIPRQAAGDIGPNRRGRLGPTDPQWPLPYPAGLWP